MGTFDKIASFLGWGKSSAKATNKIMSKYIAADMTVISSFGRDITVSDIVKTAIHRTAEAISKCVLKSVIEKENPRTVVNADDEINALFASRVNPLMTQRDFLYKVGYLTVRDRNCFIYPSFDEIPIKGSKLVKRIYKGFYPLQVSKVDIYYQNGEARIELSNGVTSYDMPYADIIHIRHSYGENTLLGGDGSGRFDARGLLQNLQVLHTVKECIPKTLEAGLSMKGVLTMKGMPEADKQVLKRDEFEDHILSSKFGIAVTDYEGSFTPININATDIPTNIMSFIQQEILYPFGVSLPIMNGNFDDKEYAAFYSTAVEGILVAISQAFTATLFTPRELAFGHKIKSYDRLTQSLSIEKRIQIAEFTRDDALLSADERRELLGYEPNGSPTRVSLNFIDTSIANDYQLTDVQNKKPIKEDDNA